MTVKDTSSVASHANTVNSAYSKKSSSTSPPNAPEGGVWGVLKYNGEQSRKRNRIGCAFLLLPGLVMMGCPKDSTDAYAVWEKKKTGSDIYLYDSEGKLLGPRKKFNWSPEEVQ